MKKLWKAWRLVASTFSPAALSLGDMRYHSTGDSRVDQPLTPDNSGADAPPPPSAGGGCGCSAPGGSGRVGNDVAVVGVRPRGQVRLTQFNSRDLDLELGDQVLI